MRPFGVDVVLIEPGFVKTPLGKTAAGRRAEDDDGPVRRATTPRWPRSRRNYTTGMLGKLACTPEAVAKVVQKALDGEQAAAPATGSRRSAHMFMGMRKVMPDAALRRLPALADAGA